MCLRRVRSPNVKTPSPFWPLKPIQSASRHAGRQTLVRPGALLDDRHIGPQRQQRLELVAERHVAVPGDDAERHAAVPLGDRSADKRLGRRTLQLQDECLASRRHSLRPHRAIGDSQLVAGYVDEELTRLAVRIDRSHQVRFGARHVR